MENQDKVKRRLAKYIYLDVVQFSKRSAEAQSDIVKNFNKTVQQVLDKYEIDDETRKYHLRIGINQNTDILVTDINGRKNVAGAGINLASRVMDKADGGQILVSQAVHHELHPSEIYMDKFKKFNATGKHNIRFEVYQFIDEKFDGLNIETPNIFRPNEVKNRKLPEETAYYFAQAIIHRQDILKIKADEGRSYWEDAIIILLNFLALDSYKISKITEFDEPPFLSTIGHGKMSFQEQYEFYKSQHYKLRGIAISNIMKVSVYNEGLELIEFSDCFEGGHYDKHYEFIGEIGKEKLKEDWINICKEFELDKYA